jgi:hypothetical protein
MPLGGSGKPGWLDKPQLLVYADIVDILRGSVHTRKKSSEALVVLRQSYVLQKRANRSHANQTQKFPFKTMYFLRVRGLTASSYVMYDYNTGGHTNFQSIRLHIYSIHTFLDNIFIYSNAINK